MGEFVSPAIQTRFVVARMAVIRLVQTEMGLVDHGGAVPGVPDFPDMARTVAVRFTATTPCSVLADV